MGKKLNLKNPRTYNEKLQWLKVNDLRTEYTIMVDKHKVKNYVSSIIGAECVFPTIGVWDSFDKIDINELPKSFVLKCTHDSGGVIIYHDKNNFDFSLAKKKITRSLNKNYYYGTREYPYKNVSPRIIVEPLMVDESGVELKDYKFFCFHGKVKFLFVATDRPYDTRFDFYNEHFNHLPFIQGHPYADKNIVKPNNFEEMIVIAEKLSANIPHVRVDLYSINGKFYFESLLFSLLWLGAFTLMNGIRKLENGYLFLLKPNHISTV